MNTGYGWWEHSQRPYHHPVYGPHYIEQPQFPSIPKTRTSSVVSRTPVRRHGSQPTPRPSSNGAGAVMLPYRTLPPPRRAESYSHPTPLEEFRADRRWPPAGYRQDDALSAEMAEELICPGASTFKGTVSNIEHAPPGYVRYYAAMEGAHGGRTDRAPFRHESYRAISHNLTGAPESESTWLALEQPCMAQAFGKSAGTTTLNYWVGKSGSGNPPLKFAGDTKPRKLKFLHILDRLQQLESGLEQDPEERYRYLYGTLIEDPGRDDDEPHRGMEQQIADLITVLTNPSWIDFTSPKNQVVAKFFDATNPLKKQEFFHQLLLSVELYLRIHSRKHTDKAKRKLILQLPPMIVWDLAVAQRWLENMQINKVRLSQSQSTFDFRLSSKSRQKDALRKFAKVLKWPNMDEIEYILEEGDSNEKPLEDRSADAMSFFSGIILPGRTFPWLIMNSLIDCDQDTGDTLKYLTHMHPASGFQYRANTYWSFQCIIGKVLGAARGVNQIGGWIGPCIYTPDLKRTECVRIRQYEALDPKLCAKDVESMDLRTNPLGPTDTEYPIDDYEVPMPDREDVTDQIRIEKLAFQPVKDQPASRQGSNAPLVFDAAIYFACGGGDSWPMKLKYDVEFIHAFPCHQGPHVLFYDFAYHALKVDNDLVSLTDWSQQAGRLSRPPSRSSPATSNKPSTALVATAPTDLAHMQLKKVLVIEALGVSDNEVFARAWCANWGLSAVVANIKETCMSCAIREAYAACVAVVILTEGGKVEEKDS